jgi:hypothetical protein
MQIPTITSKLKLPLPWAPDEETRLAVEQKDTKINKSKPEKHTKS